MNFCFKIFFLDTNTGGWNHLGEILENSGNSGKFVKFSENFGKFGKKIGKFVKIWENTGIFKFFNSKLRIWEN